MLFGTHPFVLLFAFTFKNRFVTISVESNLFSHCFKKKIDFELNGIIVIGLDVPLREKTVLVYY